MCSFFSLNSSTQKTPITFQLESGLIICAYTSNISSYNLFLMKVKVEKLPDKLCCPPLVFCKCKAIIVFLLPQQYAVFLFLAKAGYFTYNVKRKSKKDAFTRFIFVWAGQTAVIEAELSKCSLGVCPLQSETQKCSSLLIPSGRWYPPGRFGFEH